MLDSDVPYIESNNKPSPDVTLYVTETVTNFQTVPGHLRINQPGSYLGSGGDSLGWSGRGMVGTKLPALTPFRPKFHDKYTKISAMILLTCNCDDLSTATACPQGIIHRFEVSNGKFWPIHNAECMNSHGPGLDDVLAEHEGVLGTSLALRFMTENQLRWQITSGRWQKPSRGVVVAQSGPLTDRQLLRATLLRAGPHAVFAGLTAARLGGFKGFDDKRPIRAMPIYLLAPVGYKRRTPPFDLNVVTHYSRALTDLDVHQPGSRGGRGSHVR
jgi:hypothetical protein